LTAATNLPLYDEAYMRLRSEYLEVRFVTTRLDYAVLD